MINSFDELLGKTLLAGLTYYDKNDNLVERKQYFGVVTSVDANGVITLKQQAPGEEDITLPPLLDAYEKANAGTYTIKKYGAVIQNPDYIATFAILAKKD